MLLAHSDLLLIPELSVCKRAQRERKKIYFYVLNDAENVHLQVFHLYSEMCAVTVYDY